MNLKYLNTQKPFAATVQVNDLSEPLLVPLTPETQKAWNRRSLPNIYQIPISRLNYFPEWDK